MSVQRQRTSSALWWKSRKAPAAHWGIFLRYPLILTIQTPSNGTLSWYLFRLSYHHSCVRSLEKSGYAVRPGHTWRKTHMGFSQSWLWFQSGSGGTHTHASTRADKFKMNCRYFVTFELRMHDVTAVADTQHTQQRLGYTGLLHDISKCTYFWAHVFNCSKIQSYSITCCPLVVNCIDHQIRSTMNQPLNDSGLDIINYSISPLHHASAAEPIFYLFLLRRTFLNEQMISLYSSSAGKTWEAVETARCVW